MTNPVSTSATVSTSTTPAIGGFQALSNSEERVAEVSNSVFNDQLRELPYHIGNLINLMTLLSVRSSESAQP